MPHLHTYVFPSTVIGRYLCIDLHTDNFLALSQGGLQVYAYKYMFFLVLSQVCLYVQVHTHVFPTSLISRPICARTQTCISQLCNRKVYICRETNMYFLCPSQVDLNVQCHSHVFPSFIIGRPMCARSHTCIFQLCHVSICAYSQSIEIYFLDVSLAGVNVWYTQIVFLKASRQVYTCRFTHVFPSSIIH